MIQPEVDATIAGSTSALGGTATGNILAQDFCPLLAIGHGEQLYVDFSYQVVKLALASPTRFASQNAVRTFVAENPTVCLNNRVVSLAQAISGISSVTLLTRFSVLVRLLA